MFFGISNPVTKPARPGDRSVYFQRQFYRVSSGLRPAIGRQPTDRNTQKTSVNPVGHFAPSLPNDLIQCKHFFPAGHKCSGPCVVAPELFVAAANIEFKDWLLAAGFFPVVFSAA